MPSKVKPTRQRSAKRQSLIDRRARRKALRAKAFDELTPEDKDELFKMLLIRAKLITPDPES